MQMYAPHDRPARLLSERQVADRLGLTRQQFIDLNEGCSDFPVEVVLTPQHSGWVEHEIDDYLDLMIWHRDRQIAKHAESKWQEELAASRRD